MRTRGDKVKERSKESINFLLVLFFPLLYVFFFNFGCWGRACSRPQYVPPTASCTQEIDVIPGTFPCHPVPSPSSCSTGNRGHHLAGVPVLYTFLDFFFS
ncbi:hypothetical protein AAZV13_19G107300 [Glycine max]